MRYLLPDEISGAINRGKSVEQFMGPGSEPMTVRWVELRPSDDQVELWAFEVEDVGDAEYIDLYSFPATDVSSEDPIGVLASVPAAIELAHTLFAAAPDRWLNQGVIQTLYALSKA